VADDASSAVTPRQRGAYSAVERALAFLALRRGLLVCGLDKKLRLPQQMLLCAERRSQARRLSLLALVISFISDLLGVALLGSLSSVNTLSRQCLGIGMYQPVITTGGHGQLMNMLSQINHQDLQAGKRQGLRQLLARYHGRKAKRERDAVFALLSLAEDTSPRDWNIDYKISALDVYQEAVVNIIRTGNLDIICQASSCHPHSSLPRFGSSS
jgi:hypothetical protein